MEKVLLSNTFPTSQKCLIIRWIKKEGDLVNLDDILCEIKIDKNIIKFTSNWEGTLKKIIIKEGESFYPSQEIALIEDEEEMGSINITNDFNNEEKEDIDIKNNREMTSIGEKIEKKVKSQKEDKKEEEIKISPLAKKMAEEEGIDVKNIDGSGPGGRIIKRDIERIIQKTKKVKKKSEINKQHYPSIQTINISQKRKLIAQKLVNSYIIPQYYLKITVIVDNILKAQKRLSENIKEKISLQAFFIKLCAETLKKHSIINSSWKEDIIEKHEHINIGFTITHTDGIIIPVIKNCETKGIIAIEHEIKTLTEKALNNNLSDELDKPTFIISNLGPYGIEEFNSILCPPASAILSIGKVMKDVMVENDTDIRIKSIVKLTLSCDHRIIDNTVGATFLKNLKEIIEDPILCLY